MCGNAFPAKLSRSSVKLCLNSRNASVSIMDHLVNRAAKRVRLTPGKRKLSFADCGQPRTWGSANQAQSFQPASGCIERGTTGRERFPSTSLSQATRLLLENLLDRGPVLGHLHFERRIRLGTGEEMETYFHFWNRDPSWPQK